MKPLKIIVCDDKEAPLSGVVKRLEKLKPVKSPEIKLYSGDSVTRLARTLELRRKKDRKAPKWGDHEFDTVDLLVLDYNFKDLTNAMGLTGERLAYLARCYSNTCFIVVLNQFGKNRFDLTLSGHSDSFADLDLGSEQITNPGLWKNADWKGFRPWYWPVLPSAVASLEQRIADVEKAGQSKVIDFVGLQDFAGALPRSTKQFLAREDTTFSRFALRSGQGFDASDKPFHSSAVSRVAASRVGKWLENSVFVAQDVLIDLPRLLSRFPFLLGRQGLNRLSGKPLSPDLATRMELNAFARAHRFKKEFWLSRPAWLRRPAMEDRQLVAESEQVAPDTSFRFAEDASSFLPASKTRSFVADLTSPFVQRYVRRPPFKNVDYQPSLRFSV